MTAADNPAAVIRAAADFNWWKVRQAQTTSRRLIAAGWIRCRPDTRATAAQYRADLTKPGSEGKK